MHCKVSSRAGYTMVELMMVVALMAIMMAFALPAMRTSERTRVHNAVSVVRETLQTARLRSVAVNRPLQVRFNCPQAGEFRLVEAGFGESGRCSPVSYPFPAPSDAATSDPPKPRFDGPVQTVNSRVTLVPNDPGLVLQFFPTGQVEKIVNGARQQIGLNTIQVTVSSDGYQQTIEVNGLGRVTVAGQ